MYKCMLQILTTAYGRHCGNGAPVTLCVSVTPILRTATHLYLRYPYAIGPPSQGVIKLRSTVGASLGVSKLTECYLDFMFLLLRRIFISFDFITKQSNITDWQWFSKLFCLNLKRRSLQWGKNICYRYVEKVLIKTYGFKKNEESEKLRRKFAIFACHRVVKAVKSRRLR
jgi:hypothetical protein